MVGGTYVHRRVISREISESWSSTSLVNEACSGTDQEIFVLDRAYPLIEGHRLYTTLLGD